MSSLFSRAVKLEDFDEMLSSENDPRMRMQLMMMRDMARTLSNVVSAVHDLDAKVGSLCVVLDAFPSNEEGKPDIPGHRGYHEERKTEKQRWSEFWIRRRDKLADIVMIALLILLAAGFLNWIQNGGKIFGQ